MFAPNGTTDSDFPIHYDATQPLQDFYDPRKGKRRNQLTANSIVNKPTHGSSAFMTPGRQDPKPIAYDPSDKFQRKQWDKIGYQRPAGNSTNMNLSVQWNTKGDIVDWEKRIPFVGDEKEIQINKQKSAEKYGNRSNPDAEMEAILFQMPKKHDVENPLFLKPHQSSAERNSEAYQLLQKKREEEKQCAEVLSQIMKYSPLRNESRRLDPSNFTEFYKQSGKITLSSPPPASFVNARAENVHFRQNQWSTDLLLYRKAAKGELEPQEERKELSTEGIDTEAPNVEKPKQKQSSRRGRRIVPPWTANQQNSSKSSSNIETPKAEVCTPEENKSIEKAITPSEQTPIHSGRKASMPESLLKTGGTEQEKLRSIFVRSAFYMPPRRSEAFIQASGDKSGNLSI